MYLLRSVKALVYVVIVQLALRATADDGPQVTLPETNTILTGVYYHYNEPTYLNVDTTFEAFLGIPFAEPPVGDLRFRKPVKKGYLGENYAATEDKDKCPQGTTQEDPNEDCLYLGVFSPSPRLTNAPVMVWIHGGAYWTGSGSDSVYKPYPLLGLAPDIVVVTINYRLGVLGFLTTGDEASPGNYGMFDQVMALEWVRDNIAAFGGDPTRVTIMGESAGGASVGLHLLSPLSGGLFNQAIMESGNAVCPWAVDVDMERQVGYTMEVAVEVNCPTSHHETMMDCLRDADLDDILFAQSKMILFNLVIELVFTPVVDKDFLPDLPIELIKRKEFHSVPSLLGTNKDEGTLVALRTFPPYLNEPDPPTMSLEEFREVLPTYLYYPSPLIVPAVEQWYIDWTKADNSSADHFEEFIQLQTDQTFACGTELMARTIEESGAPVYRYEFTYVPSKGIWGDVPGWMGAGHGEELQYVFAWGLNPDMADFAEHNEEENWLSVKFMRHWTNFIRTGDTNAPLPSETPEWPRYTLPEQEYKILSPSMDNGRALRMDSCAFWLNYAADLYKQDNPDYLYRDWQEQYEQWRDVDMVEWNEVFDDYKNDGGCT